MSETWEEFRHRCAENVRLIRAIKDDGTYAKLYAQDVDRLLRMLTERGLETGDISIEGAFEVTDE